LLELDRAFGMSVAVESGIRIPKTFLFDPKRGKDWEAVDPDDRSRVQRIKGHLKEAIAFVRATDARYVLKPHGNAPNTLSYVSADAEDMGHRLTHLLDESRDIKPTDLFVLQEFIAGVEISTEVWVSNGEIVGVPNATIETKHFLAGDLGPNTGCQTSVVWAYDSQDVKILRQTIGRPEFRAWLKNPVGPRGEKYQPYHGPLDINCIVDEKTHKPFMLEWTPRFGYSAIYALLELLDSDPHDTFTSMAKGTTEGPQFSPGYGYAVRVSIPPYPMLDDVHNPAVTEKMLEMATHVDILGPVEDQHVWLLDAQKNGKGVRTAGVDAVVCEVTGRGMRIEEARDSAHAIFGELRIADKQARTIDGADRAVRDVARLASWEYETPEKPAVRPPVRPLVKPAVPVPPKAKELVVLHATTVATQEREETPSKQSDDF
jgi:phosphoribosylamine-glycine ligase